MGTSVQAPKHFRVCRKERIAVVDHVIVTMTTRYLPRCVVRKHQREAKRKRGSQTPNNFPNFTLLSRMRIIAFLRFIRFESIGIQTT
jgi:hypothetical protein